MCGICGVVSFGQRVEENDVRAMAETIAHRGPDSDGFFVARFQWSC